MPQQNALTLRVLPVSFSVCKLECVRDADVSRPFCFLSVTDDEVSLVCETEYCPANTLCAEHGWKALKIEGQLDFGMVGVIAAISDILAKAKISLFVVSTYNTDYVLVKEENAEKAILLLEKDYTVLRG